MKVTKIKYNLFRGCPFYFIFNPWRKINWKLLQFALFRSPIANNGLEILIDFELKIEASELKALGRKKEVI